MTQPTDPASMNPFDVLVRQGEAIEMLTRTMELMQGELRALRRRVETIEGAPLPAEPPEPG